MIWDNAGIVMFSGGIVLCTSAIDESQGRTGGDVVRGWAAWIEFWGKPAAWTPWEA